MSSSRETAEIWRHLKDTGMVRPSYLESLLQSETAIAKLLDQQHVAINLRFRRISTFTGHHELINQSNRSLVDSFKKLYLGTEQLKSLPRVHASWTSHPLASAKQLAHVEERAKKSLFFSFNLTSSAKQIIDRIDFEGIRSAFSSQQAAVSSMLSSFESLAPSYRELARGAESLSDLTAMPSFVMPSVSRELLVAGHVVASLSPEDDGPEEDEEAVLSDVRETTSSAHDLIYAIDPGLAKAYQGAREALLSGSIDRSRHVLGSLRELWGHLLRTLAPDDKVLPWAVGKDDAFLHEGKPTRRARLSYVCREIDHEPLSDFLYKDSVAFLKYFELFNRVHEIDLGLSDKQLDALLLRTDSWLIFIIQVAANADA